MDEVDRLIRQSSNKFDFVFSHTCPYSWMPRELFLSFIDQSTVDNTMELWLDTIKDKIEFNTWLFAHYHSDKVIQPHVELLYTSMKMLSDIDNYWKIIIEFRSKQRGQELLI